MDPFYAFILFAVVVVLELLAAQTWFEPYYRAGIPVSIQRVKLGEKADPAVTARLLEQHLKNRPEYPTIRFRPFLGDALAFRESLFENRSGFKYLPAIHSIARFQTGKDQVTITGYLDWYILFALVYIVYRTSNDPTFLPVGLLVLFIFCLSYFVQVRINRSIARELAQPLPLDRTGEK